MIMNRKVAGIQRI